MSDESTLTHGGRLGEAARRWGIPRSRWLDLSTGINPRGWPVPDIPAAVWQRLPEDDDGLDVSIRAWVGAPASAACIPVPGTQAAIQALPGLRRPGRVGIPEPGYREHARCWRQAGHQVIPITPETLAGGDDSWLAALDVLVWINPNNPTALALSRQHLLAWQGQLHSHGGWLVVDEAFVATDDGISVAPDTGQPGLVVLRSLGKFFGLAGVRAGAVLTDADTGAALAAELGPWAVSGPARYVMARALADSAWQAGTASRLRRDSERLDRLLARHGLGTSAGTLLFRYLVHDDAGPIADALARQGILVRRFDSPPALRFGLPATPGDWRRLDAALASLINIIDR